MKSFRWVLWAGLLAAMPAHGALAQDGGGPGETVAETAEPAGATGAERSALDGAALRAAGVELRLEVSVSDRVLRVIADDSVLRTYAVAVGKPQYPTPRGSFTIQRLIWNPRWIPPASAWARNKRPREPGDPENPMGRVKLFFREPDYYIHGTNRNDTLGQAASHGCVRMANDDVVELARLVMEYGGDARPDDWFHRILSAVRRSSEVRLAEPVRVSVVP